jgi:hypothetical protein
MPLWWNLSVGVIIRPSRSCSIGLQKRAPFAILQYSQMVSKPFMSPVLTSEQLEALSS